MGGALGSNRDRSKQLQSPGQILGSSTRVAPTQNIGPYPCQIVSEVDAPHGWVPHYLPGENPHVDEFAGAEGVPVEAMRGGAETMLPEFRKRIRTGAPGQGR
jgi:hypothetical protein